MTVGVGESGLRPEDLPPPSRRSGGFCTKRTHGRHYVPFLGSDVILCPSCSLPVSSDIHGVLGASYRSWETLTCVFS